MFDDNANHVFAGSLSSRGIEAEVFMQAEKERYWGEIVGDRFYLIPWLDKCSQSSMLEHAVDFRAPESGLLFVQFVAPGCGRCAEVSDAIRAAIVANPSMPVRWIEVSVPRSVGRVSIW
jgi:hypothetical protein